MSSKKLRPRKILQLALIAGLLALIGIGSLTGGREGVPTVSPWEGELDRMVIRRLGEVTELIKEEGQWLVGERKRPADEGKLVPMADALRGLRLIQRVSSTEDYHRYGLEGEEALLVEAYEGERLLRKITLGRTADRGNGAYITLEGKEGIFLAGGNLRSRFDREPEELRNRQIFSLALQDIISVEIEGQKLGAPYRITKGELEGGEAWKIPELGESAIDQGKARNFISELARISAIAYIEPQESRVREILAQRPQWTFRFQDQSQEHRLEILGPDPENENAFLAQASSSEDPFTISAWKTEQLARQLAWFVQAEE